MQNSGPSGEAGRPLRHSAAFFASMVAILVFANWSGAEQEAGFWHAVFALKWYLTGASAIALGLMLVRWFGFPLRNALLVGLPVIAAAVAFPRNPAVAFGLGIVLFSAVISVDKGELGEWFSATWGFARLILPLAIGERLIGQGTQTQER